ncbi:MAG: hypothetical protein H8E44_14040 [Planctomycetes bacterium]|nr:hypothetical protein [Planctomycetota bacterium]
MKMKLIHYVCVVCIVLAVARCALAAEKTAKLEKLPEPISSVSGNLPDLEKGGHFEIIEGRYGTTEQTEKEALIWTVKVAKSLTGKHAMTLLRSMADVRFYRTDGDEQTQLHATELYYSSHIVTGAAEGRTFRPNERFQIWLLFDVSLAQSLKEKGADSVVFSRIRRLPNPLNDISGNFVDLEKSGYFKIIKDEYGRTREFDEEAVIWTLKVVKPLSCGHAMILLRRLSDVRFYRIDKDWRKQLHSAFLYYPSHISTGAVRHDILDLDEWFEVWIPLSERESWHLRHHRANTVEFRELKR